MKPPFPKPKNPFTNSVSKYKAIKTVVDGRTFDSKSEANRYGELKFMKLSGIIKDFKCQVRYNIEVNNQKICAYVADFVVEYPSGKIVVEDVKGFETKEYKLKKKLMLAVHGICIHEIKTTKKPK